MGLENFFVVIAVMCVPVMLAGKPLILYLRQRKLMLAGGSVVNNSFFLSGLLFSFQVPVENVLVVVAFLCVPWMLLVKPFYLRWRNARGRLVSFLVFFIFLFFF